VHPYFVYARTPHGHGPWNSKTTQECRPRISGLPRTRSVIGRRFTMNFRVASLPIPR
jgi:hypothetical protein